MREVIFEINSHSNWKSKIKSIFCFSHLWKRAIDIKIGEDDKFTYSIIVWKCVDCSLHQLWILKEWKK